MPTLIVEISFGQSNYNTTMGERKKGGGVVSWGQWNKPCSLWLSTECVCMQLLVEAIIAPGWLPSISKLNHTYWLLSDEIVCTERLVDICYLHVFENLI